MLRSYLLRRLAGTTRVTQKPQLATILEGWNRGIKGNCLSRSTSYEVSPTLFHHSLKLSHHCNRHAVQESTRVGCVVAGSRRASRCFFGLEVPPRTSQAPQCQKDVLPQKRYRPANDYEPTGRHDQIQGAWEIWRLRNDRRCQQLLWCVSGTQRMSQARCLTFELIQDLSILRPMFMSSSGSLSPGVTLQVC